MALSLRSVVATREGARPRVRRHGVAAWCLAATAWVLLLAAPAPAAAAFLNIDARFDTVQCPVTRGRLSSLLVSSFFGCRVGYARGFAAGRTSCIATRASTARWCSSNGNATPVLWNVTNRVIGWPSDAGFPTVAQESLRRVRIAYTRNVARGTVCPTQVRVTGLTQFTNASFTFAPAAATCPLGNEIRCTLTPSTGIITIFACGPLGTHPLLFPLPTTATRTTTRTKSTRTTRTSNTTACD